MRVSPFDLRRGEREAVRDAPKDAPKSDARQTPTEGASDENERQAALHRLQLLDTEPEPEFDDLVHLAAAVCEAPVSLMTLLDGPRQWFKAVHGVDLRESPREFSICEYAIQQPDIFVVEDALQDPRFADNPFVTGADGVRFYAGVPVASPEGIPLGALCVMDIVPRRLKKAQAAALKILGRQVTLRLELRAQRMALHEALASSARTQQRMEATEQRFRAFMDSGPFLAYVKDADGAMLYHNDPQARRFGAASGLPAGKTDAEVWPPEFSGRLRGHDLEVLQGDKLHVMEESATREDGSQAFFRSYKFPCRDADGTTLLGGISLEVTEELLREAELRRYQAELETANAQLRLLAATDPLTGLANRRAFDERLILEFAQARRKGRELSVVLIDVDNFKGRNDRFGHLEGDATLRQFAGILKGVVRETDLVARYGGEEFAVLLPEASENDAVLTVGRMLEAVRQASWHGDPVRASAGVAAMDGATRTEQWLVSLADEALYAAKHSGKDRVVGYGEGFRGVLAGTRAKNA